MAKKLSKKALKAQTKKKPVAEKESEPRQLSEKEQTIKQLQEARKYLKQSEINRADYARGFEDGKRAITNRTVDAYYTSTMIALHDLYGFGQDRCIRVLREIETNLIRYINDDEMINAAKVKVKIDIVHDEAIDKAQPMNDEELIEASRKVSEKQELENKLNDTLDIWCELKSTILGLKNARGEATQEEVCQLLLATMKVLEDRIRSDRKNPDKTDKSDSV